MFTYQLMVLLSRSYPIFFFVFHSILLHDIFWTHHVYTFAHCVPWYVCGILLPFDRKSSLTTYNRPGVCARASVSGDDHKYFFFLPRIAPGLYTEMLNTLEKCNVHTLVYVLTFSVVCVRCILYTCICKDNLNFSFRSSHGNHDSGESYLSPPFFLSI